jgi:hypothetical protein
LSKGILFQDNFNSNNIYQLTTNSTLQMAKGRIANYFVSPKESEEEIHNQETES